MREILFRGRTIAYDSWVEGFYVYDPDYKTHSIALMESPYDWYDVDPETVGQFTGLLDMNGRRIFEGDVVFNPYIRESFSPRRAVEYADGGFGPFVGESFGSLWKPNEVMVIGNIHDNPDLIKV